MIGILAWWGAVSAGSILFGAASAVSGFDWLTALGGAVAAVLAVVWPTAQYVGSQVKARSLFRENELLKGRLDIRDERLEEIENELVRTREQVQEWKTRYQECARSRYRPNQVPQSSDD